jgi:hypothetical protein
MTTKGKKQRQKAKAKSKGTATQVHFSVYRERTAKSNSAGETPALQRACRARGSQKPDHCT